MDLEETLAMLPKPLREVLEGVVAESFGTKPFSVRGNPDYRQLAKLGLLTVLKTEGQGTTTYQMPEAVYDALRRGIRTTLPSQEQLLYRGPPLENFSVSSLEGEWGEEGLESKVKGLSHTFILSIDEPKGTRHFNVEAILFRSSFSWLLTLEKAEMDPHLFSILEKRDYYPPEGHYLDLTLIGQGKKGAAYFVIQLFNRIEGRAGFTRIQEKNVLAERELLVRGYGQFGAPLGIRRFVYLEGSGTLQLG